MERTDLEVKVGKIETKLDEIHHALLGNGNPGFIRETNSRLGSLENSRSYFKGGTVALWSVITLCGGALIKIWLMS